ncbi:unnamed protein product, partial [Soboliphyme baturini]|uniref:FHA domain-containing protein n=1 Tax=Soboliphyme baturini TaxID=241478 RepID=A0A183JAB7_9BILA
MPAVSHQVCGQEDGQNFRRPLSSSSSSSPPSSSYQCSGGHVRGFQNFIRSASQQQPLSAAGPCPDASMSLDSSHLVEVASSPTVPVPGSVTTAADFPAVRWITHGSNNASPQPPGNDVPLARVDTDHVSFIIFKSEVVVGRHSHHQVTDISFDDNSYVSRAHFVLHFYGD